MTEELEIIKQIESTRTETKKKRRYEVFLDYEMAMVYAMIRDL